MACSLLCHDQMRLQMHHSRMQQPRTCRPPYVSYVYSQKSHMACHVNQNSHQGCLCGKVNNSLSTEALNEAHLISHACDYKQHILLGGQFDEQLHR